MSDQQRPKWETVAADTERLPVPGGWLYQVRVSSTTPESGVALCFVPDSSAKHVRAAALGRAS